ncbi:MAG: ABC transporter ATP-binding protein [Firmicutes bacterium]|nr:ABC transporter ATP-binding protein [Bacillota bacterium]
MSKEYILKTENLGIDFGGLTAVNNLNLKIEKNQIYGLIGPNGAGKTTVFNLLTKVYEPTRGKVIIDGQSTEKMDLVAVNKLGIARTFQNIRLFKELSVLDNVKVGLHNQKEYSLVSAIFRLPKFGSAEKEIESEAMELLDVLGLKEFADFKAKNLPYGKQRKLEIARALATHPKILLLDEPAAGMNPAETAELLDTVKFIRDHFQIAILLIEHDMKFVMGLCEKITVLNFGEVLAYGDPDDIKNNPEVIAAYLGSDE